MDKVVYVILARVKDIFNIIYVDESEKTDKTDFFTKNEKFKCWMAKAGLEQNLYLSIYPMWESDKTQRRRLVDKTIAKYKPVCNMD